MQTETAGDARFHSPADTFYSLKAVASQTGVPVRTLHYWISKEIFIPSVHVSRGPNDPHLLSYTDLQKVTILNALRFIDLPEYESEQQRSITPEVMNSVSLYMKSHGVPRKEFLIAGRGGMVATADTPEEVVEILERGDALAEAEVMIRPTKVLQELEARISPLFEE